ncbi:hypothetical protein AVEN_71692-1 [Araneus ventricosus]|uniref:Uncharacterized protein n=1 Tax=Araneus ventricosus TaxID=182803 RepID=A0A4Y2FDM5_ARAVE|nr:hypothetical protein AVEN_71692-1 [Araneus ventricosus]
MEVLEHGKEKPVIKVENLSKLEQMIRNGGVQKNLKSKIQSADSNSDLDARVAAKQRICLHWHLASRLEMKLRNPPREVRGVWVAEILRLLNLVSKRLKWVEKNQS